ncbi:prepilin-type N-terminal cleavage/methylation domain-containing protein [Nostoc punctiforme FACHB-252]|jgi:type II secretory pathway pseudopilin PulG|uniref:Prepilin-type N-terminal cleavage/methylation domain-containing protein n=1 Tax=Nostoc punctiforme FACHB-252 TaxID=1357509 RepID=A0ABR8HC79_NOSPU|nr:hormogonium polysaccharide secretion pseudopilin HpsC [Nostoc punctiforme]MBD2613383.1 prepilin-type N-terminal cleavage/methylation domain-containing protein [Nostoc punctiforme FACHB-252]
MKNLFRFLLSIQLKHSKFIRQVNGFTLIELLVALLLAFLVLTPLLGFMINILSTDQKEQAKANSEQEIQMAADYIANDLQQAVYIYNATALTTNSNTTPANSGIKDQIPPIKKAGVCDSSATGVTCEPILVFWKRKFIQNAITPSSTVTSKDDTFVYSLVSYYLIKDNNTTWSKAARIARFEISDGVLVAGGVSCGTDYPNDKYVDTNHCPDAGFQRFNLNLPGAAGITQQMNSWKTVSSAYTQQPVVLIDFIDQTSIGSTSLTCPSGTLRKGSFMGFYACIDVANTAAQVFLRGNALARLQNSNFDYSSNNKTYFPTASVRVQGRGYLFTR